MKKKATIVFCLVGTTIVFVWGGVGVCECIWTQYSYLGMCVLWYWPVFGDITTVGRPLVLGAIRQPKAAIVGA